jgi:hypothetical protein
VGKQSYVLWGRVGQRNVMFCLDITAGSDVASRKGLVAMGMGGRRGLWLRATLWLGVVGGGSGWLWL